jgi:predicted nucleic acid-binding protein
VALHLNLPLPIRHCLSLLARAREQQMPKGFIPYSLLDSSVLLLLQRRQRGWEAWRDALAKAASEGALLLSPVAFAESSIGYGSATIAMQEFASIQIRFDPLSMESAWVAGQTFLRYRREGGPRQHLIPDFLIAAHGSVQAGRLAAIDRGYLRRYFPNLPLLTPEED